MKDFDITDLQTPSATEAPVAPKVVAENHCVTIFQYHDRWAVRPNSGDNYIFPTLGQALAEAKRFLTNNE